MYMYDYSRRLEWQEEAEEKTLKSQNSHDWFTPRIRNA